MDKHFLYLPNVATPMKALSKESSKALYSGSLKGEVSSQRNAATRMTILSKKSSQVLNSGSLNGDVSSLPESQRNAATPTMVLSKESSKVLYSGSLKGELSFQINTRMTVLSKESSKVLNSGSLNEDVSSLSESQRSAATPMMVLSKESSKVIYSGSLKGEVSSQKNAATRMTVLSKEKPKALNSDSLKGDVFFLPESQRDATTRMTVLPKESAKISNSLKQSFSSLSVSKRFAASTMKVLSKKSSNALYSGSLKGEVSFLPKSQRDAATPMMVLSEEIPKVLSTDFLQGSVPSLSVNPSNAATTMIVLSEEIPKNLSSSSLQGSVSSLPVSPSNATTPMKVLSEESPKILSSLPLNESISFPPVAQGLSPSPDLSPSSGPPENRSTIKLDKEQVQVFVHCRRRGCNWPKPLIVQGSSGTGKTATIALSAVRLAGLNPCIKILICTHANLTADEYISHYFDKDNLKKLSDKDVKVLRVNDVKRRTNTVNPATSVRSRNQMSFVGPTKNDVKDNQIIVVTLNEVRVLKELKIPGIFTHIFIDEAVEEDDSRTWMSLADEKTCIVLAGCNKLAAQQRHKDAKVKLGGMWSSVVGRPASLQGDQKIQVSNNSSPKVILSTNYRNHVDADFKLSGKQPSSPTPSTDSDDWDEILLQLAAEDDEHLQQPKLDTSIIETHDEVISPPAVHQQDARRSNLQPQTGEFQYFHIRSADSGSIFSIKELKNLVKTQPDKYKSCILNLEEINNMHGRPTERPSQYSIIKLANRKKCGHGFHGDEVVIEVTNKVSDNTRPECEGNVVGVLNHCIKPCYRRFVCRVDEDNNSILIPINSALPKIKNYEAQDYNYKNTSGKVFVYSYSLDQGVEFQRYEEVMPSKLFEVQYFNWKPKSLFPIGIVVAVIDAGYSIPAAINLLDIEHNIQREFTRNAMDEVGKNFTGEHCVILAAEIKNRSDFRKQLVFTINPTHTMHLHSALSLQLDSDNFVIGVHVADVSFWIPQGSFLDQEAHSRGIAIYPEGSKYIPMLPEIISSDICSLVPGQDRLTISCMFTVDCNGNVKKVEVKKSVIQSAYQLSYNDVEGMIAGHDLNGSHCFSTDLISAVVKLSEISQIWAKKRLGTEMLWCQAMDKRSWTFSNAHTLLEEFTIATNHLATKQLLHAFPLITPLFLQMKPNEMKVSKWKSWLDDDVQNSAMPSEQSKVIDHNSNLSINYNNMKDQHKLDILRENFARIRHASCNDDWSLVKALVLFPEYHPQLGFDQYSEINNDLRCVSSGDIDESVTSMSAYTTHFTSPIQNYFDIVVQRLLVSSIDGIACPFTAEKMIKLCIHCSDATSRSRKYEHAALSAQICDFIQKKPVIVLPIVQNIDATSIQLSFPTNDSLILSKMEIKTSDLNLSAKPDTRNSAIFLRWSQRIYDTVKYDNSESSSSNPVFLNSDNHILKANLKDWKKLLCAVLNGNVNNILGCVNLLTIAFKEEQCPAVECLSSEGQALVASKHFCEYATSYHPGSIVKVQLTTERIQGLLVPTVQLLYLTNDAQICLEHGRNAVQCFANITAQYASKNLYDDIANYQSLWLPVLKMASTYSAVKNEFSAIVHNIQIDWKEEEGKTYTGTFQLPMRFCKERSIYIVTDNKSADDECDEDGEDNNDACTVEGSLAYVCVRYVDLKVPTPDCSVAINQFFDVHQKITWVGHCVAVRAKLDKVKKVYTVDLLLNQSSVTIPSQLLEQDSSGFAATIEWIGVPSPNRLMENVIQNLNNGTILAQRIALGKDCPQHDAAYASLIQPWINEHIPGHKPLNLLQSAAVEHALTNTFSLIHGPPGTGKTVVSVNLAYLFAQINKNLTSVNNDKKIKPQVMCCGPSNKSVDVLAGYLSAFNFPDLRIVRVYSGNIVQREFTIPGQLSMIKNSANFTPEDQDSKLRSISLHHMIRDDAINPKSADFIRIFDHYMSENACDITSEDVMEYKCLIANASARVLKTADIVLVTTAASATKSILKNVNIQQLIIDECGMCTEPESFVPIVATGAKHIVLVGDDKQLRPIIENKSAEKLGLDRSLFARYSDAAFMLKTQYRMHQAIAELPSLKFYDNNLSAGTNLQLKPSILPFWPAGGATPIAFVHHVGTETSFGSSSTDVNEQSKCNLQEVDNLVLIVTAMVAKHGVNPHDIAVLTQYRAQCNEISRRLTDVCLPDVTVQTITTAQGSEWEYVLLSTVRSLPEAAVFRQPNVAWKHRNLGFIVDEHQVNVALTRARKGLIILGNKFLLGADELWSRILLHYQEKKALVNAADFISAITDLSI